MDQARQNYTIQKWICGLSVILFGAKFAAWYLTRSVAILSDALESIVNIVAGFIGLYSLYVAAKPRDMDHPYGHGKAEFVSAAAEGAMIFVAGVLIIYQAIVSLLHPSRVEQLDMGLILVVLTAGLNYGFGYFCLKIGKKNNSLALQASGKHLQIDTFTTLGIVVGLIVIKLTHLDWIDAALGLFLGVFVVYNGYKILRASIAGIMDEADMTLLDELIKMLNESRRPNWIDIHNLKVVKYGSFLHVDCHLTLPYYLSVLDAHEETLQVQKLVRQYFPEGIEINIHIDPCHPASCPICTKEDCHVRSAPFEKKLEWTPDRVLSIKQHQILPLKGKWNPL